MKNKTLIISGALLGLIFVVFGANFFFEFFKIGGTQSEQAAQFMGALFGSGYLAFVKAMEILGGLLTAIPKTRNLGLIVLIPIIVNIFAYKIFLQRGGEIMSPDAIIIAILTVIVGLLSAKDFLRLLN